MIYLGLIAAILLASAALAALELRVAGAVPVPAAVRRLRDACGRASADFLGAALLRAAPVLALAVAGAAAAAVGAPGGAWSGAFWVGLAAALGLGTALLVTRVAGSAALAAAGSAVAEAPRGTAPALARLLGGAAAMALTADLAATAGAWLSFALPFAVQGGFSAEGEPAADLARRCAALVPVYGLVVLGTCCGLQHAAGGLLAAARGAEAVGGRPDAAEPARHPALVTRLVALVTGGVVVRAHEGLMLSTVFAMGTVSLGVHAWTEQPTLGLAALALPWVTRALASLASAVGLGVVQPQGTSVLPALWRAEGAALVVCCAAIAGAATWLAAGVAVRLSAAAAVLVVCLTGTVHLAIGVAGRRSVRREASDWTRLGGAELGSAAGVAGAALGLAALSACLGVAAAAASTLAGPAGVAAALRLATAALLGLAPWLVTVGLLGPLAELSLALERGAGSAPRGPALAAVQAAGSRASGWSRSVLLTALVLVMADGLALLAAAGPLASPAALAVGALAAVSLSTAALAHRTRSGAAAAQALLRETESQAARAGEASAPGYRPAFQAASSAALAQGWQATAWPLVVAVGLAALTRGLAGAAAVPAALLGLVATALCLCVVLGLGAALVQSLPRPPAALRDAPRAAGELPAPFSPLLSGGAVPGLVPTLGMALAVALLTLPLTV